MTPEPITLDEIQPTEQVADVAPKRGPGRPKGSRNKPKNVLGIFHKETAQQNRETNSSPSRARRGRPAGRSAHVKEMCIGVTAVLNLGINAISKDDVLSDDEMTLLSSALEKEANNNERILRWMSASSPITAHFALVQAAVIIALPRLQRRGILPKPQITEEQARAIDEYYRQHSDEIPTATPTSPVIDFSASSV